MRIEELLRRAVAVTSLVSTLFVTLPVSAAELAGANTTLGAVSGSGFVSLRGVSILQEGTIFNGDVLEVGVIGYARVMLIAGHRLELDVSTKININQIDENNISIHLDSGNVAFTRSDSAALTITAGPYEIRPARGASGSVAFVGKESVGLRSIKGVVAVRQMTSRATYSLAQGEERILMFSGQSVQPLAQVASAMPTPVPAVPPLPQTTTPAGRGLTKSGWIAILATVGGAATAIAILATRGNDEDNTATLSRQRAVQGLQAALAIAQQAQSAAQQILAAAGITGNALNSVPNAATRATLQGQVNSITNQVSAAQAQITSIITQLNNLLTQLQNAKTQAEVASLTSQVNALIGQLNTQIQILNNAITQLQNVVSAGTLAGGNIPPVTVQPVPTAGTVFSSPVTP